MTGALRGRPSAATGIARPPGDRHAGRPPWWAVALSVVLTAGVTADLLAGSALGRLDARVAAVVGGWDLRHGAGYPLLWLATELGGRGPLLVVLAALVGWVRRRRGTWQPLGRAVLALVLLTVAVYAFKLGAGRTAPAYPGSYFHRDGGSYPSGHVADAVLVWGVVRWQAVAYGLPAGLRRAAAVLAVAAPVVAGTAMLVLDFHWLTDVVVGAAVGIVLLALVHVLDPLTARLPAGAPRAG